MIALRNRQLRFTFASLLIAGSLLVADVPAGGTEDSSSVPVEAQVIAAPPACQDTAAGVSFQPALTSSLSFQLPSPNGQLARIDLNINNGQTPDCDTITGRVTFTQSGFQDSNGQAVSSPEITGANCIFVQANFIFPTEGIYTCGQAGESSPGVSFASPTAISIAVGPGANPVPGTYTNIVSINLIANP